MNPNNIVIKADKALYIIPMNDILYITVKGNYCHVFTEKREYVVRSTFSKMLDGRLKKHMSLLNRSMAFNANRVTGLMINEMHFDNHCHALHPTYLMKISKNPDQKA
jgi:DNA-binding LytR/AlgR family response regulator